MDVTGVWEGQWFNPTHSYGGQAKLTLQQTGSEVTGEIQTNTTTAPGGPLRGTVAGNVLTFSTPAGVFANTELAVKGDEMSGRFFWFGLPATLDVRRAK